MIKIDNVSVMNFDGAMRGARNPLNSWDRSDSYYDSAGNYILGKDDLNLAIKLCRAGSDHRKFIRQIMVSVDITAPLYWWKEFDTYKVGTVANSTSTMHKIHSKPFELDDFSCDHMTKFAIEMFKIYIDFMERKRQHYVETQDKSDWYDIIQLLPSSYNQKRTITMNYENLMNMYYARKSHKLTEWHKYCNWILELPYTKDLFLF